MRDIVIGLALATVGALLVAVPCVGEPTWSAYALRAAGIAALLAAGAVLTWRGEGE